MLKYMTFCLLVVRLPLSRHDILYTTEAEVRQGKNKIDILSKMDTFYISVVEND